MHETIDKLTAKIVKTNERFDKIDKEIKDYPEFEKDLDVILEKLEFEYVEIIQKLELNKKIN